MAISGQCTVSTAGTEQHLVAASTPHGGAVAIKALPGVTGIMYIGWTTTGVVSATTGFPLKANEQIVFAEVSDLYNIMVDGSVSASTETVAWLLLDRI